MTDPTDHSADASGFAALDLDPALVTALGALGYEEPTPIQREAIPFLLEGRDLLGQAATGTGKTAAFSLPMLQRIAATERDDGDGPRVVRGLILVPTRELAMQVAEAVHKYGRGLGIRVLPVYGGQDIRQQLIDRCDDAVASAGWLALLQLQRRIIRVMACSSSSSSRERQQQALLPHATPLSGTISCASPVHAYGGAARHA